MRGVTDDNDSDDTDDVEGGGGDCVIMLTLR